MAENKKRRRSKGQQIVLPDEVVGKHGRLLGVLENPDGSKSLYFAYSDLRYSDDTVEELKKIGASVNVFNRHNPLYWTPESVYTSSLLPYTTAIDIPTDPHERIKMCRLICILEPVVGTVVDILVDISYNGFKIDTTGDDKIDEFYREFNESVDMDSVINWIFQEYYYSGDVTVYKDLDDTGIPVGYTVLNPLCVRIEGSLLFNNEIITLDLQEELDRIRALPSDLREKVLKSFPSELRKYLTGNTLFPGRYVLPPEKVSRITRKKQPYERYATPMLTRLIFPVLFKHKLRLMDLSTIEGVINQLMVVTVGDKDHPPTDETLKQVASLFLTPKKSFTVFWDWTLKVNVVTPNAIETLYQNKYEQVNDDISKGLGVPRSIIDGTGANYATAFVGVQMLIERASREIMAVKKWLEREYKEIARIKGFKTYPRVRFDKTQLRQENYVRQILAPLYDRGLLSAETILAEAGFNYQAELERKKRHQENIMYFLPPDLPYTGKPLAPLLHQGREPGQPSETYERDIVDTPDAGPSEVRPPKQMAAKTDTDTLIEKYISEYSDVFTILYDNLMDKTLKISDDEDDKLHKLAHVFQAFKETAFDRTFSLIARLTSEVYELSDRELTKLSYWHSGALNKFVQDIYSDVAKAISSGDKEAIKEVFEKNRYRVELFATEGILEGYRVSEIMMFRDSGVSKVRWVAVMDDKTCSICAGRHGVVYPLFAVPSRPHCRCRCWIEPVS